jgi:riboflavin synthase
MFTGLIQTMAPVLNAEHSTQGTKLTVQVPPAYVGKLTLGASVALDGVCTTVVSFDDEQFVIEASPETLSKTTMGSYKAGQLLNLELPLSAGDPLGGHFVTGHVDGVGRLLSVTEEGLSWKLRFGFTELDWNAWLIEKGSVAVQGISLTVNEVFENGFAVAIIPHTWQETNLSQLAIGQAINLEFDMLGKYVVRLTQQTLLRQLANKI